MTGISDRMGANSKPKNTPRLPTKPKKVSGPKTNPKKMPCRISEQVCWYLFANSLRFHDIYRDYYHESSDCFEYPKKSLLQIKPPKKNTCQILLPPKNPGIETFKATKSSHHPRHLKSEVHPPPPVSVFTRLK